MGAENRNGKREFQLKAGVDEGAPPHRFECPQDYYGVQYYEGCSKVKTQLESRCNQVRLRPVANLGKLLVGAANSDDFSKHLEELQRSCFGTDIESGRVHLVYDAVRTALPEVRQVTNIITMYEAFNKTSVAKTLLGEVHKLLIFDIPCGIGDFRAYISSDDSRTT